MLFFVRQKVQISSKILSQIPKFANFVKFHQKSTFSSRRPVFVISSVFRQKKKSFGAQWCRCCDAWIYRGNYENYVSPVPTYCAAVHLTFWPFDLKISTMVAAALANLQPTSYRFNFESGADMRQEMGGQSLQCGNSGCVHKKVVVQQHNAITFFQPEVLAAENSTNNLHRKLNLQAEKRARSHN